MTNTEDVAGFVLAGGASSRFGRDKAGVFFRGHTLLDRAVAVLRTVIPSPRIVLREPARAPVTGPVSVCPLVVGERPGLGPVEALRAALGSTTREWALLTGVDMPGLDSGALGALLRARADGVDVVCFADSSGRRHPLPGCYRRSLLDSGRLEAGGAFQALLDAVPLRTLSPPTPVSIANVNRPTDFVQFWNGPPTPNWVCSDASEPARRVEPLSGRSVEETWTAAELWLRRRGDVTIVLSTPDYIAAEFRIPVFGYVDDLELNRRGDSIAVRSASRVGIWDMGVNRRRVEAMRRELRSLGVVA